MDFSTISSQEKIYFDANSITTEQLKSTPSLASNYLSSNGIMNNFLESFRNTSIQLGGFDSDGRTTLLYDPTAKGQESVPSKGKTALGFFGDTFEVGVNYLGATFLGGMLRTSIQEQNQEFIKVKADQIKAINDANPDLAPQTIILSGHSGGGLRNFLTLQNSNPGQFRDGNGNSVLTVISYGSPTSNLSYDQAANNSGARYLQSNINAGDPVGYVLGGNGDVVDAALGLMGSVLLVSDKSRHSNYYCQGFQCISSGNFNIYLKPNNFDLTSPKKDNEPW